MRSYAEPLGFDRSDPKTHLGNALAFRCWLLLRTAARAGADGLFETPRRSKMRWLPGWKRLLTDLRVEESWLSTCGYGCYEEGYIKREFALLGANCRPSELQRKCPGFHAHIRIEGAVPKHTAAYHPAVADAMAGLAVRFVERVRRAEDASLLQAFGCERPAAHELAMTSS